MLIFLFTNFVRVKRLTGILFLSVLLLQVAGSYVYFIVRLSDIRKEMRELLKSKPEEELTLFTLSRDEFRKAKVDDHEIKVEDRMYDIARIDFQDEQVLVYALHDEVEDNLLSLLNEMVKRSTKDKKPVPSQLIHLLTLQFVIIENNIPVRNGLCIVHTTTHIITFLPFDIGIESPPPRG